ncbi:CheR family methyltransferase [Halocola ammonii]
MSGKNTFPIIGIGASAGGLEPLEAFFENIDPTSGYAFVVIQHLAPNHKSLMDELLARHTSLPIKVIENGLEIEANHIYLNPPKKFVELKNGKFVLSEKEDRKLSFPISSFFESLAYEVKDNSAAIVVSGTGSDGSEGIKYIKEMGGLVIAQDPDTAKFDGMPKNAIQTSCVDKVCKIREIPKELAVFFDNKSKTQKYEIDPQDKEAEISEILDAVYSQTSVSFADYKISTIYRRTTRRMGILGYSDLTEYRDYLRISPTEAHQLASELLIGVTRFFRDEEAFQKIYDEVIPKIVESTSDIKSIRVWVPACSTGEEAYSLAILFKDYLRQHKLHYDVTIFATDLDKEAIKIASNRIFPESISNEVPTSYLNNYFIPQKKGYSIAKEIREMIVFSIHNVIQDPPFSKIDLLSCRNFLIYLNSNVQQRLYSLFQYALKQHGVLFLGSSESLGQKGEQFSELDSKHKIYLNKNSKKLVHLRERKPMHVNTAKISGKEQNNQSTPPSNESYYAYNPSRRMLSEIQEAIIQEFAPDTIVYSDSFELVHTTGKVNQWLKLPQGEISTNILRMLPDHIALSFEMMTNRALGSGEVHLLKNIKLDEKLKEVYGEDERLHIHIRKLASQKGHQLMAATFLVKEKTEEIAESNELDLSMASREKIDILERELRVNQENLQTTIEELESSNEELQAANEELQSSNEELESVNEELYTVNAEYQEKVEELSNANNDLNNLIQSTDIALLFLDSNLNIRKFTPAIKKILNLNEQDIGRHVSNFRGKIQVQDLMEHVDRVYDEITSFETTVKDDSGKEYIVRMSPFKTMNKEIQGVIITFFDITAVKSANRKLELSNEALNEVSSVFKKQTELFEIIARNSNDLVSLHNLDGEITYLSPSAQDLIGYTPESLMGKRLTDLMPKPEHQEKLKSMISDHRFGDKAGTLKVILRNNNGHEDWYETKLKQITDQEGKVTSVLATTRDIRHKIEMTQELDKLSLLVDQTTNSLVLTDADEKITFVNNAFEKLTGFEMYEVLGKKPGDFLQGEETDPSTVELMRKSLKEEKPFDVDVINYTKTGEKYWVSIHCEPMYDHDNTLIGFFSIQHEATIQRDYEERINKLNDQLREQNSKLSSLNKNLEEFAYVASHDLKAPLRNIIGMINLIQKKRGSSTPEMMDKYFEIMSNAVNDMNSMIENLLKYSRSGKVNEELETVNLAQIMREVKKLFSQDLKVSGGKITFNSKVDRVRVYPILFKRLMTNLLSNALKYSSEDREPEIKISCVKKGHYLHFKVEDNGIGIEESQFDFIFQVFKSIQPSEDSNGIGLSICRNIVESHNGKMWVESEPGKGSTFHFEIEDFIE